MPLTDAANQTYRAFTMYGPIRAARVICTVLVEAAAVLALVAIGRRSDLAVPVGHLGPSGLFELLTLVGYYAALALQLRVLRVPAPRP